MLFEIGDVYRNKYEADILLTNIYGGVPTHPKIVEGWLRKVFAGHEETQIKLMVRDVLVERHGKDFDFEALTEDELMAAIDEAGALSVNGFKRDRETGELYIEGRQVKACIKEAASIAMADKALKVRGWGNTNKGLMQFIPEHIFVPELVVPLGVTEPTGVDTNFVHTWRGDSIKREEYVENAKASFSVVTDYDFDEDFWKQVWTRAQLNGLGASRSQGRGCFEVLRWEKVA
jgi:hypothetical protein